jgi:hypothetical protein
MFEAMLASPNIDVMLGTDYRDVRDEIPHKRLIFTGPIDEFFDFRFGRLPYRSLRFEHVTLDEPWYQPVGTVNFPQTEDYTRISEYKHMTGQDHPKTSITYEYPAAEGDPYYPIPRPENAELFKRYERLAFTTPDVWFVGRLATYRYYNMDQVVGQALATYRRIGEVPPPNGCSCPGASSHSRWQPCPAWSYGVVSNAQSHASGTAIGTRAPKPVIMPDRRTSTASLRWVSARCATRSCGRPSRRIGLRTLIGAGTTRGWTACGSSASGRSPAFSITAAARPIPACSIPRSHGFSPDMPQRLPGAIPGFRTTRL